MEVELDQEPKAGEVLVFTAGGGGFSVKGTIHEIVQKLSTEEWPSFELTESGGAVVVRSAQVVALRGGNRPHRASIGFVPRH